MADLLRSGYTMLNIACPICKNPIFRNRDGETFCPICNRKVLIVENQSSKLNERSKNSEILDSINTMKNSPSYNNIHNFVKKVIFDKIKWSSEKLENETQLGLIEKYIKVLLNLYKLLEELFSIDNAEK
ncbi:MAG: Sjogren's syndrome/scleroderma autoantigen 1 family protein [Promethearchaeota archaeon]